MTQVGHSLTGVAIGILSLPNGATRRRAIVQPIIFALLANIPDIEVNGWGHRRYEVSHSVFVNLGFIFIALGLGWLLARFSRRKVDGSVVLAGAAAWLSHMLLDSFYNHGNGLKIFWPFSTRHLALPIPWFAVVQVVPPPITAQMVRVVAIEFICYLPIVFLALWLKRSRSHFVRPLTESCQGKDGLAA